MYENKIATIQQYGTQNRSINNQQSTINNPINNKMNNLQIQTGKIGPRFTRKITWIRSY